MQNEEKRADTPRPQVVCGIDIGYAQFSVCMAHKGQDGELKILQWTSDRIAHQDETLVSKFRQMIDYVDDLPRCDVYVIENQFPFANKDMIALQYGLLGHLEKKEGRGKVHVVCQSQIKRHYKLARKCWAENKKAALHFVRACGHPELRNHNMADSFLLVKYFTEVLQ